MDLNEFPTEAAVTATLAQQAHTQILEPEEGPQFLAHVNPQGGISLQSLERYEDNPRRAKAQVQLHNLDNLVAYLAGILTAKDHPVIFADATTLTFTAFPSYHQPGLPSWLDHVITVKRHLSRQLKTWKDKAGKRMTQEEFALFLDANLGDIHEPVGAEVLSFAEKLEATRMETFKSAVNSGTGEVSFTWNTERSGDSSAKLITDFKLRLPVFDQGELVEISAKIYHRIPEGKLTFWFDLRHLDHIIETIWKDEVQALRVRLAEHEDVPVSSAALYEGTPPAQPQPLVTALQ